LLLYKPKRIAINGGYFGCHETIRVYADTRPGVQMIDLDDEYQDGDLCWLETPVNPTGEARYAHMVGNQDED
jgi:cystathionine gamma-synthase